jgi:hypothetical protein
MARKPLPPRRPMSGPAGRRPPGVTIGDINEAGGNPMTMEPRDPRQDSRDVPRRPHSVTIHQYKDGGYVCKPNPRKGNIDMRKKGMTRMTKDNRKKG